MARTAPDVTPAAAWEALQRDPRAVLVDCRTEPEWQFVGVPDLAPLGRALVRIPWQGWPDGAVNPRFVAELRERAAPDQPVYVICRSGARSLAAANAALAAGYAQAFNVAGGFEGPRDAHKHRGTAAGWKYAGLPWTQE